MNRTINLACTLNQLYALPFTVMIASVVRTRRTADPIVFHVLDSGLTADMRELVERTFAGDGVSFGWIRVTRAALTTLADCVQAHASPLFYQTLLLPEVLPVDRVIYLDVDLLCLRPIDILWQTDLGGAPLGAVQDMAIPTVSSPQGIRNFRNLGLSPDRPYFNAGVMVIDLAEWRARRLITQAIEYLCNAHARESMHAQDALNAIIRDWTCLPLAWNVIAGVAGRPFFQARHLDAAEYRAAVDDPAIVHFAGRFKPWLTRTGSRFDSLFHHWRSFAPSPPLPDRATIGDRAAGYYDRTLRSALYRLERFLWERRP